MDMVKVYPPYVGLAQTLKLSEYLIIKKQ